LPITATKIAMGTRKMIPPIIVVLMSFSIVQMVPRLRGPASSGARTNSQRWARSRSSTKRSRSTKMAMRRRGKPSVEVEQDGRLAAGPIAKAAQQRWSCPSEAEEDRGCPRRDARAGEKAEPTYGVIQVPLRGLAHQCAASG
jgi:hypothetical protein